MSWRDSIAAAPSWSPRRPGGPRPPWSCPRSEGRNRRDTREQRVDLRPHGVDRHVVDDGGPMVAGRPARTRFVLDAARAADGTARAPRDGGAMVRRRKRRGVQHVAEPVDRHGGRPDRRGEVTRAAVVRHDEPPSAVQHRDALDLVVGEERPARPAISRGALDDHGLRDRVVLHRSARRRGVRRLPSAFAGTSSGVKALRCSDCSSSSHSGD